jgi:hypothetical protein
MAPFALPIITSIAGAAVTGLMNKGSQASMPTITPPSTADQDTTKGIISNPALASAANQKVLSNTTTTGGRLLGS